MYEVLSRQLTEQPTLVMTAKLAMPEIPEFLQTAYGTVARVAGSRGVGFAGPPFARYRFLDDEIAEIEAGFPVTGPVEPSDDVVPSSLPGGAAAVVIYLGPYEQMEPAFDALQSWIEDRGAIPEGPHWEVYLSDPTTEPDPSAWRTEIIQPYR